MKTIRNLTNSGTARALKNDSGEVYDVTIFTNNRAVVRLNTGSRQERFSDIPLSTQTLNHVNRWVGGTGYTMEDLEGFTPIQVDPIDPRIDELAKIMEMTGPHHSPREALVVEYGTFRELYSYGTHIATITNAGKFIKHWSGYTRTTMVHINKFREYMKMDKLTGEQWNNLPTE